MTGSIYSESVSFEAAENFNIGLFWAMLQDEVDPGRKNFGLALQPEGEVSAQSMTIISPIFKVLAVASIGDAVKVFIHIETDNKLASNLLKEKIEALVQRRLMSRMSYHH